MRLKWLGIHWLRVLQYELGEDGGIPRSHRNAQCRLLSEEEALAFAVDPALGLEEQWIREAFARGELCLAALEGGRLVGHAWIAFGDAPCGGGVWARLGPGLRHVHAMFVRPGYSARRIAHALNAHAERAPLWHGRRVTVTFVEAHEYAALLPLQRAGSRTLGHVVCARLFGKVVAWRSAGVRRAGLRFCAPPAGAIADRMEPWLQQSPPSSA
jgi:GNAT superfamily N-acetyltransferase